MTASKNQPPKGRPPAPDESGTAARGPHGRRRIARTLRIAPVYGLAASLGAVAAIVTACSSSTPNQSSTTGHAAALTQPASTAGPVPLDATGVQTPLVSEDELAALPPFARRTRGVRARQPERATQPPSAPAVTTSTSVVIPSDTTTALVTPASTPTATVPAVTPTTTTTTAVPKTITRVLYPSPGQTVSVTTRTVVASPGAEPTTQTTWRTTSGPVPKH